ncbi:hypothetical protein [Gemmata sp.]|uniref:hypothetical protein n=1 Tax=Gemmata sp. TaxID=1914242 RepID=UPI003F6F24B4
MSEPLSTGRMALRVGVLESQLRRLIKDRKVPFLTVQLGAATVLFDGKDAPVVRQACIEAGYLLPEAAGVGRAS